MSGAEQEGDQDRGTRQARARGTFRVLTTASFLFSFAVGATRPLVPLFAVDLGATPALLGLVVAAGDLLPVFLAINVGILADRLGCRRLMIAGTAILILSAVLRIGVPTLLALGSAQAIMGIANLLFFLATQSYVAQLGGAEKRVAYFGTWFFVTSGGQLIGPIVAGALADLLSTVGWLPIHPYRAVFAVAIIAALPALMLSLRIPESAIAPPKHALPGAASQAWRVGHRGPVVVASLTSLALMLSTGIRHSFYPVYLAQQGYATSLITLLYSASPFAAMCIRPFLGYLSRKFSPRLLIAAGLLCAAAGWSLVPIVAGNVSMLFLLSVLGGLGIGLGTTMIVVMVSENAPLGERGLALGIRQVFNRAGDAVGPALFGIVAGAFSLAATFGVAGIFGLLGLLPLSIPTWNQLRREPTRVAPTDPMG